jgi:hypothetical protein
MKLLVSARQRVRCHHDDKEGNRLTVARCQLRVLREAWAAFAIGTLRTAPTVPAPREEYR